MFNISFYITNAWFRTLAVWWTLLGYNTWLNPVYAQADKQLIFVLSMEMCPNYGTQRAD